MYFVETGTLVVLKQIDGEEKEVKRYFEGNMFISFPANPR